MKPKDDYPGNTERLALRNWLVDNGMKMGDAAVLTAPGHNRGEMSYNIAGYLRDRPKGGKSK